ncbi:Type 1 glutamine amidotransferase-like domain-containing protein [Candidatus Microgenomates bacterium]|nr:Type 1 glutamine amidotransferase-like domain-containing protein [Candidatus Microgenomates bacterium]
MKLFLASEGSDPKTTEKLEKYLGGFKGKSVVYIPTARNGENPFGTWKESGTWNFLSKSGMDVFPIQLEDHKDYLDSKLFDNKDIIWFSGGACGYLMYWILRTSLDKYLPKILKKSVYVGSSAGSMIASKTLNVAEWYIDEYERGAKHIPGLNLVDFDMYPHYNEDQYDEIKNEYGGKKLYLLKDGEAILVDGEKVELLGEERLIVNE